NALTGDLDMSLLSATTSDKTLDSFGHELEPNDRSTSHYNDLGGDLELSCLSVTPKDTTADSFSNDIGIDSSVVHLLDSSILDLDNSAKFLKEDSLLHTNSNSISQPLEIDDCRFPELSSNIIPDPFHSFNREIFMILQNYKKTGDSHAAISHLHELQVESFHNELVYSIVMEAIDSELEVDETRWLKLLTSFMLAKIIANDQLKKAMLKIFDMLEWIHRNIPNGIRKLVRFCNKCQTAGIMEDELISILNSNCLKIAIKEVDSSNNTNEVTKEPKEYKETKKKKILSKDPLTNNRMFVRKLRHQVVNLEKEIKQLENLVGLQTIKLCKLDKRMTAAIKSLVSVFEEELDKQSEQHAKASFLLCQLLNFNKDICTIRYCQWTLKYSIALQGRSPTLYNFLRAHNILTLPCRTTIISYTGTTQGEVGLTNVNIARLKMLLNSLTQPHEGRISIEIDEMACKALLLWMQSRQKFVGEVDFGGVSMTDEDWNAIFEEENEEQSDEEDSEENVGKGIDCDGGKISEEAAFLKDDNDVKSTGAPVLANSLINFVITGITKKYSALAGSWPVAKLTGKQLF
ncbi:Uncharacterized protein APZ42_000003, partial [Daphnia magna]